jgi:hypothetical protein
VCWGVLAKLASVRLSSPTVTFVAVSAAWLVTALAALRGFE